jgi:hypothetical protein
VESTCEFGYEPSGSMKCWEPSSVQSTRDLSSSAQLYGVRVRDHWEDQDVGEIMLERIL